MTGYEKNRKRKISSLLNVLLELCYYYIKQKCIITLLYREEFFTKDKLLKCMVMNA